MPNARAQPGDERGAAGFARHVERAQSRVPARHGRTHGIPRARRRQLLELARAHVSLRAAHERPRMSRRSPRRRMSRCWRAASRAWASFTTSITILSAMPYGNAAEMAERVAAAAMTSGIGLTLLPVFYAHGGFGGQPPTEGQRRFVNNVDGFACLLDACGPAIAPLTDAIVGVAPHSLRAVTPAQLRANNGARCRPRRSTFTPRSRCAKSRNASPGRARARCVAAGQRAR